MVNDLEIWKLVSSSWPFLETVVDWQIQKMLGGEDNSSQVFPRAFYVRNDRMAGLDDRRLAVVVVVRICLLLFFSYRACSFHLDSFLL